MSHILIRDAQPIDYAHIVELNQREVQQTSPMDLQRTGQLDELSAYHRVCIAGSSIVAFLLVMSSDSRYQNDNFNWFAERYSRYLYIDRIVVDEAAKGQGVGQTMYQDVFSFARRTEYPVITCEVNTQPANPASLRFHQRMGFTELGQRHIDAGQKTVVMLAAPVSSTEN